MYKDAIYVNQLITKKLSKTPNEKIKWRRSCLWLKRTKCWNLLINH